VATNRREALGRAFALLGAAIGIGAASRDLSAAEPDAKNAGTKTRDKQTSLVLHARALRISSQDLRRGELPRAGVRMTARAEIVAGSSKNQKLGEFFSTYHRVNTPGKVGDHEPGSLEQHTFILADGTLFGTGVSASGMDGEGQFAIVGGTGRYHGARGSYVARQSHADFGGSGAATFTFTLV
jgi:hypothetical protein